MGKKIDDLSDFFSYRVAFRFFQYRLECLVFDRSVSPSSFFFLLFFLLFGSTWWWWWWSFIGQVNFLIFFFTFRLVDWSVGWPRKWIKQKKTIRWWWWWTNEAEYTVKWMKKTGCIWRNKIKKIRAKCFQFQIKIVVFFPFFSLKDLDSLIVSGVDEWRWWKWENFSLQNSFRTNDFFSFVRFFVVVVDG